ncbi:hypothetical protein LTS18_011196 [Coniosporium uncinatum]|uniref:Uncharacterized protein n=1 Tax=Coniosporium uncinatum TaxID=93489 RepID=A0ACC3D9F9_9PEZI|nr:hypothetical protein LTS18_011196 [Coniosporium uncinatum]
MTKIFATGCTGYIGGDALYAIANKHPEYDITCLARNSEKGGKIAAQYPNIKLVYGDLNSAELIETESEKADIVCHFANCDHEASAAAIVKGLSKRPSSSPGFLIHTSGTGILEVDDLLRGTYGTSVEKVYDDWKSISAVTSLPDEAWHRNVDKIVLAAGSDSVKTAIVCPPTIYGPGRGPDNQRSDQIYKMAEAVMKRGKGFYVGEGQNKWASIHVHDLSKMYMRLVEEAAAGGGKATYNEDGYYFTESAEFVWKDMAENVAKECKKQGFIKTDECESVSKDEADQIAPHGAAKWGMNSRCRAVRGYQLLGWSPESKTVAEELPDIVKSEAERLGLVTHHAAKAAGTA